MTDFEILKYQKTIDWTLFSHKYFPCEYSYKELYFYCRVPALLILAKNQHITRKKDLILILKVQYVT